MHPMSVLVVDAVAHAGVGAYVIRTSVSQPHRVAGPAPSYAGPLHSTVVLHHKIDGAPAARTAAATQREASTDASRDKSREGGGEMGRD